MTDQTSNSARSEISFVTDMNGLKLQLGKFTVTAGDTYIGHNPPSLALGSGSATKISIFNNSTNADVNVVECAITGGNAINDLQDPVNVNDIAMVNNIRGPALVVSKVKKDEDNHN
ncbi:hypothetical protein BDN70DRAFT_674810 [Pholiota conissans]|uniref:Uncharacterized protein n=1 Tax=Pholiota conissans TaxID=109636 RepID=A0A9P5Z3P0_9AGAR|nr:hypothetical protein BDN70DRAFT_674810 [Pholiota conissans]